MTDNQQPPQQAYDDALFDICNLMAWLEIELGKTPDTIQWAHVGSLNKIREDLQEVLSFITDFDTESLKEALEECRLDRPGHKSIIKENGN